MPGILVLGGALVLSLFDGGATPTTWYPAALFALGLLVVALIAAPPLASERSRLVDGALIAYGLFCIWGYLSIVWADAPGDAWNAANRALAYGIVLAIVTLHPWRPRDLGTAIGLVGLGLALVAAAVLVGGALSDDPADLFLGGRLQTPAGYLNATAGLWLIGFFPALSLALTRSAAWWLRGLGMGSAALLMQTALLSQSRGAAIAFCVVAVLFVIVVPARWPALLALAGLAALLALAWGPLTDVREARFVTDLGPALDRAVRSIALGTALAAAAGGLAALIGRKAGPRLSEPRLVRAGNVALIALAIAGVVAALVAVGNPGNWVDARWQDFKTAGYTEVESGRTRFTGSLGSNRYDFYRVALNTFRDHPLTGIGGDNFAEEYLLHRRSGESPRHPHSLVFQLLSQLGIVGTACFAAFLGLLLAAVVQARQRCGREGAILIAGALCGFALWFVQGLADWLWIFTGLSALALGLLGAAARLRPDEDEPGSVPGARRARQPVLVRAAAALAALAVAISLGLPGAAARYTSSAYEGFADDPDGSFAQLDRAAELDPLSAEPVLAKGVIARRLGRGELVVPALRDAVEREPQNWFAHLELGMALAARGQRPEAIRELDRAVELDPRDELVRRVRARVRRGQQVDAGAVERALYGEVEGRLRPTDTAASPD